jgi:crotonobetainyl-CoA:carnitine CoA-transferase CaiB-like acyl-CoA transferase
VLEIASAVAGPFASMMLADLGAEVIKVEPINGDHARSWGPPFYADNYSAYFASINRGKKSIAINLGTREGIDIARKLVSRSDVIIEAMRPGAADKLGIGYMDSARLNPGIIYCSISGFGQWGPYRNEPGYDIIALAMSGLMDLTGEPNGEPVKFGVPIIDIVTSMYCVTSILAALRMREKNGKGTYIDLSLMDSALSILTHQASQYLAGGEVPRRMGSAHPTIVPYQAFKGSDDKYFIVAVGNDKLWESFCKAIGREDLLLNPLYRTNPDRVRNREALIEELRATFNKSPSNHWIKLLKEAGVPVSPILNVKEAVESDHAKQRGAVLSLTHPRIGAIKVMSNPIKSNNMKVTTDIPPPMLGEHTQEVLSWLGYSNEEITDLLRRGIARSLASSPP